MSCVGVVAFMALSSCSRHRVLALFIYSFVVYPLFGEFVFWLCDSYVLYRLEGVIYFHSLPAIL